MELMFLLGEIKTHFNNRHLSTLLDFGDYQAALYIMSIADDEHSRTLYDALYALTHN